MLKVYSRRFLLRNYNPKWSKLSWEDRPCPPCPFSYAFWSYRPHLTNNLLAEFSQVFISCKVYARRSVHSPWYHHIITLIISWLWDTWSKWPLARKPDRNRWHQHTSLSFLAAAQGSMGNRLSWVESMNLESRTSRPTSINQVPSHHISIYRIVHKYIYIIYLEYFYK